MNIAVPREIVKIAITVLSQIGIKNFEELEEKVYALIMAIGREIMATILEIRDLQIMAERDEKRYRSKGLRKACIRTKMGEVEYRRRVYQDLESIEEEKAKSVYLLDEELQIKKIGRVSAGVCKMAAHAVSGTSYRESAKRISEQTGERISHQALWNLIQAIGSKLDAQDERNAELDEAGAGRGEIETKILYEENDGIWISLQGKSRKENSRSKEMKVGITYDGVRWIVNKAGKKRRILNTKTAIAGFMPIEQYRRKKEGQIGSVFKKSSVELRVVNGDGGSWTLPKQDPGKICVLDEYHRNKKITECVRDKGFAKTLRKLLYENRIEDVLNCIEGQINSVTDEEEIKKLEELQNYYRENKDVLKGYYDRGIAIPETREPGTIHHAQLGSMESNIFTLIGNRMKGRRACWSIQGGNHMASILCAYHTTGLENIFAELPEVPDLPEEEEWIDEGRPLSASQIPDRIGVGYEYPKNVSTTNYSQILRKVSSFVALSDLSL